MKRSGAYWLPDDDTHFGHWLDRGTPYQDAPRRLALANVKHKRRAVDVGAHVGTWAVPFASVFESVEAFEPTPANLECLRANVEEMNVNVHGHALGRRAGFASMRQVAPGNSGMMALDVGAGPVEVKPLDAFGWADVDLLKLDVEGSECDVLIGGEQTVRASWPVIVAEDFDGEARALLFGWGYRCVARRGSNFVLAR